MPPLCTVCSAHFSQGIVSISTLKNSLLKLGRDSLSGVKDDEPLGPLLIHDPVAALPAPDGVPRPDLVLVVALAADVDHRRARVHRHGATAGVARGSRSRTSRSRCRSSVHDKFAVHTCLNIK